MSLWDINNLFILKEFYLVMSKINLEQLKPQAHPFRAIFRKHKITNAMLAKYLDRHVVYVTAMLGGHLPVSKPVYEKLELLVNQLEADQKEACTIEIA